MSKDLPVLDAKATFVDVGSERMHVSIGGDVPMVFGTVTSQLHALRDWLLAQGVRSVAMEATGVYWLPLYSVLEAAGLEVRMVSGRQTRNAPGRKTDMQDAQWGATLHMHGLLRAGFVPPADIRRLQDYLRLRADHVNQAGSCVQLMQKALERMNIKLHDAISSLAGASGMAIMRAIVAGERDPATHVMNRGGRGVRSPFDQIYTLAPRHGPVRQHCGRWRRPGSGRDRVHAAVAGS